MTDQAAPPPGKVEMTVRFSGFSITIDAHVTSLGKQRDLFVSVMPRGDGLMVRAYDAKTRARLPDVEPVRQFVEAHLPEVVAQLVEATVDPAFRLIPDDPDGPPAVWMPTDPDPDQKGRVN